MYQRRACQRSRKRILRVSAELDDRVRRNCAASRAFARMSAAARARDRVWS
jgi:hypothetical protein